MASIELEMTDVKFKLNMDNLPKSATAMESEYQEKKVIPSEQNNSDEQKFNCTKCNARFKLYQSLECHFETKHKEHKKPYACSICKRRFLRETHMLIHQKLHKPPDHACNQCGKKFDKSVKLRRHVKTVHQPKEPVSCRECGEIFSTGKEMRQHIVKHGGVAGHKCDECGELFLIKSDLIRHLQIHAAEKPFPCDKCGRYFKTTTILDAHMRTHSEQREIFNCTLCTKTYLRKSDLKRHKLTHTVEKPKRKRKERPNKRYKCEKCDMEFFRKSRFISHLTTQRQLILFTIFVIDIL